jgi:hypothetical protein
MSNVTVKKDDKRNTVTISDGKTTVVYTVEAWTEVENREDRDEVVQRALKAHAADS